MQRISRIFECSKMLIVSPKCYLRYLRPEFLGEYLPKVDEKHLKAHRTNRFTKYSEIDTPQEYETADPEKSVDRPKMEKLYPELFPYLPLVHLRDSLREKLEIREMMKRRKHLEIPEFYVGSIMAVTVSDPFAASKSNRFVGICIARQVLGLLSTLRLRNVVDKLGIEIEYEIYNPTILKIEVLKLERRLDTSLFYLRDAPPEYSTVPFDIVPEPRLPGEEVPLNPVRVRMNPRPWSADWHHHEFRGMADSAWDGEVETPRLVHVQNSRTRIDRYDLMKIYRERGPPAERHEAMRLVEVLHHQLLDYHKDQYQKELDRLRKDRVAK